MASVNRVTIIGNLGRDPEAKTFPSGDMVANITVATTDRWRDKNTGEQKEATEWHRVVFNGRLAEVVTQYLRKGSQVYIEGSLRTRKWTDQATGQERYATEIRADTMQMLGARQGGQGGQGGQGQDDGYGGYDNQPQSRMSQQPQQGQQQSRRAPPPNGYSGTSPRGNPPPQRAASGFDDMSDDITF